MGPFFKWMVKIIYLYTKMYIKVDPEGLEPSTSSMPLRRAPKLRHGPNFVFCKDQCALPSGPGGIRTLDLFSAIEARSQTALQALAQGD